MNTVLPNHIAIIPDGNRRWAKEKRVPSLEGHRRGFDVGIKIAKKIRSLGVHTLTMWAFSTENWNRPPEEVKYLMKLYETFIDQNLRDAMKENTKLIHIGRKDRLPDKLIKKLENAEKRTQGNTKNILNIALDYGGRDEVVRAVKRMRISNFDIDHLSEENFGNFLDTADQPYPDPDLIIRTSGEMRTSGLMIWQAAYAEYLFLPKYFPDVTETDMEEAVEEYARRQRRFGH